MRTRLNQRFVDRQCHGELALYWDNELPGFGIAVGASTKTFVLQRRIAGRVRRLKIGRVPAWSVEAARKRARELIVAIDQGLDPVAEKRRRQDRGVTLAAAIEAHVGLLLARGGSEATAQDIRYRLQFHLGTWMSRPLAELTRFECRERHQAITKDSGPYAANCAFRYLRAIYHSALKVHDIPAVNPCMGVGWNKMERRREPIAWAELPRWREQVEKLPPIRRDYQLFVLFTALRSTDAATVRWEHVNLDAGTMHRPNPKGGPSRKFTVPIAAAVVEILKRRKEENAVTFAEVGGDGGWAFPCWNRQAQPAPLVYRRAAGRGPHRLRDSFASAAHACGLDWMSLKCLLNHAPPSGDTTAGYILPSVEDLRPGVERVVAFLRGKMDTSPLPTATPA